MPVLNLDAGSQPLFQPAPGSVTVINLSDSATVYVATTPTVHDTDIPIGPLASMTFDGAQWWYGSALNTTAQVAVGPGVTGYFLPASLSNIGGSKVYVQAGAPTGTIPLNSVWFDTANGSLQTWNGSAWVNQAFSAQNLIQAATILGTQIAAQAVGTNQIATGAVTTGKILAGAITSAQINGSAGITGAQLANGTLTTAQLAAAAGILGTQIASATITSANIAANTIVAGNIAANTITAAQLAAGIVYAGIVDSTTINAATFTGSTYKGTDFIINSSGAFFYSGTPALGNLIASVAGGNATTADPFGNTVYPGITSYVTATQFSALSGSGLTLQNGNFPWQALADSSTGDLLLQFAHTGVQLYLLKTGQAGSIVPNGPGTLAPETWHPLTPNANWAASGNGISGAFYRLLADSGEVEIAFDLTYSGTAYTAAGGGSGIAVAAGGLPSAYRPATVINLPLAAVYSLANAGATVYPSVGTDGSVTMEANSGTAFKGSCAGVYRYPLGAL